MIAYNTIDFNSRAFLREIVYPAYYFVLGSFDSELEKWLSKFSDAKFKNFFPDYEGHTFTSIAQEINSNTHHSQQFRKAIVEFVFSVLVDVNELE